MNAHIPFVRVRHWSIPSPSGCRWCGDDKGGHGMQYTRGGGGRLHFWEPPTTAQRKARMLARRKQRLSVEGRMQMTLNRMAGLQ